LTIINLAGWRVRVACRPDALDAAVAARYAPFAGPAGLVALEAQVTLAGAQRVEPGPEITVGRFRNEYLFDAPGFSGTINFEDRKAGLALSSAMFNARFRVYPAAQTALALAAATPAGSAGAPSPSGGAAGGEVEDYQWAFGPNAVMLRDFSAAGAAGAGWPAIAGFGALGIVLLARRRQR